MNMGTLPPNPWDISLSGRNGCLRFSPLEPLPGLLLAGVVQPGIGVARRALLAAAIPAAESALGSHPCVALSSAQVSISICPFDFALGSSSSSPEIAGYGINEIVLSQFRWPVLK